MTFDLRLLRTGRLATGPDDDARERELKISDFKFQIRPSRPRRAFTLMEVLLVLVIIVIIAGVAWTAMQRPLAHQRLSSAADDVRGQLITARQNAEATDHTYVFRYKVHGNRYRLEPEDDGSLGDSAPASSSSADPSPGAKSSAADDEGPGDLPPPVEKTLPQAVRFLSENATLNLATMGDADVTTPANDSGEWSDPIRFYANGTASDAQVWIASNRHLAMRLVVRGVTGTVTVNDGTTNDTTATKGNP